MSISKYEQETIINFNRAEETAYIFTYDVGRELVLNWLGEGSEVERRQRYARLLTEQMTPSQLAAAS